MHVLVTGGAGFIGNNLVRLLLAEDYQISVLDNFKVGQRDSLERLNLKIIAGDILDPNAVKRAVVGVDAVVHLAAQTGVPGSIEDPYGDCQTNVIGTLNLLEACRHANVTKFIFASSNAPLGRQPPPATETKAPLPISPYGASKLAGEGYCLAYHGSWGLNTIVFRFANLYGPHSKHKKSVVAKFFNDIAETGRITVTGGGQQTRDFIYVEDLCRAVLLALNANVSGEVFQIATGVETSILELATMVQNLVDQEIQMSHEPARIGDIQKNYSAITKVRDVLGWEPKMTLGDGLQETWRWFQS
ncbi:MAG: NAD-dependent epimerase/dehydratase family protein [Chloroflexota bacterium]